MAGGGGAGIFHSLCLQGFCSMLTLQVVSWLGSQDSEGKKEGNGIKEEAEKRGEESGRLEHRERGGERETEFLFTQN